MYLKTGEPEFNYSGHELRLPWSICKDVTFFKTFEFFLKHLSVEIRGVMHLLFLRGHGRWG